MAFDGGIVATVPHERLVAPFTSALDRLDPNGDWVGLDPGVTVLDVRGPAQLAYADAHSFVPAPAGERIEALAAADPAARASVADVPTVDADEAGVHLCPSPLFCIRAGDRVVAAAGFRTWCGTLAHMAVLVAPGHRGAGRARAVGRPARSMRSIAVSSRQWRAVSPASQAVGAALGFEALGRQVSLELGVAAARIPRPAREPLSVSGGDDDAGMATARALTIDCGDCVMAGTGLRRLHRVVHRQPRAGRRGRGRAAEERALRSLSDGGLVPHLRHEARLDSSDLASGVTTGAAARGRLYRSALAKLSRSSAPVPVALMPRATMLTSQSPACARSAPTLQFSRPPRVENGSNL